MTTNDTINYTKTGKRTITGDIANSREIVYLNIKAIISNKSILSVIILFIFMSQIPALIFVPFWVSGAMMYLMGVVMPGLVVLGWTGYNVKRSTIYLNIRSTGFSRTTFYLAQLITVMLLVNILAILIWTLTWFLGLFPIFLSGWIWEGKPRTTINPMMHWTPITMLYSTCMTGLVMFATYFLIDSFTSDARTYFFIVLSLMVIGIIFGGSLNTYFAWPHDFWYYNIPKTAGSSDYIWYNSETVYVTESFFLNTNELNDLIIHYNEVGISIHQNLFPTSLFIPTLFNPFYGVGEFTSTAVTKHMAQDSTWWLTTSIYVVNDSANLNSITNADIISNAISLTNKEDVSIWSWFNLGWREGSWAWTMVILQPFIIIASYLFIGKAVQVAKDL